MQFLPGDLQIEVAGALQREAFVAPGNDVTLVVWTDYRSSPDNGPPFATVGGGSDIYAARVDGTGAMLDPVPLVINGDASDQYYPRAAWNGTHWLVTWAGAHRSGYLVLSGVRVAPDGSILDAPFRILNTSPASSYELVANGETWLVGHQSGTTVRATRVAADGTVLDPAGVELLNVPQLSGFELESAGESTCWAGARSARATVFGWTRTSSRSDRRSPCPTRTSFRTETTTSWSGGPAA